MTTSERKPEVQSSTSQAFFGVISLLVPRIRPHTTKEVDGTVFFDVDLGHKDTSQALDQLEKELNHPRLKEFRERVLSGHSKAWYTVVFGGISIVVASAAAAAGVEFGARHGKDIQGIFDILTEHKKGKK